MRADRAAALNAALATARLTIEPMTGDHADGFFAPLQNAAIYAYISSTPPESAAALRARWERLATRLAPDGSTAWLNWAVRRTVDGALVGRIDAEVDDHNVALNVGYVFLPAHWGQGYASEAVRAVVTHLVACGVVRLIATVTVGNDASCRVLEKAGFTCTRILPGNDTIRGTLCDDIEYVRAAPPDGSGTGP